jgi:hypothetical protein
VRNPPDASPSDLVFSLDATLASILSAVHSGPRDIPMHVQAVILAGNNELPLSVLLDTGCIGTDLISERFYQQHVAVLGNFFTPHRRDITLGNGKSRAAIVGQICLPLRFVEDVPDNTHTLKFAATRARLLKTRLWD